MNTTNDKKDPLEWGQWGKKGEKQPVNCFDFNGICNGLFS